MLRKYTMLTVLAHSDEGASAVEYGLLVALIVAVIIGAVTLLGTQLQGIFNAVAAAAGGARG